MRTLFICILVLVVFQRWDDISSVLSLSGGSAVAPYVADVDVPNDVVVLYATKWCGYCKRARQLLRKHDIEYIEYDIEASREGRVQYDRLGGGACRYC
ncbi:glutaredoxin family protein [Microbulbifer sp. OS29]|uniref:Glutaredoxin family protein n=1 Tax=Microbulbifer okhotskensis TaxID=2926617 RepID=A0A9X2ESH4_9GAMM|nr:glutaredoxin domain-containing protein [Microbulbifer okhotskensis]MCO1336986.1 glutaredoxin family protein [Microbulbifer okhotskensis]